MGRFGSELVGDLVEEGSDLLGVDAYVGPLLFYVCLPLVMRDRLTIVEQTQPCRLHHPIRQRLLLGRRRSLSRQP